MPKENKDNCRAIFLELEDLEEGSSLASEVTLLWGPGKGEDKLWKSVQGQEDIRIQRWRCWGREGLPQGRGKGERLDNLRQTGSQPAGPRPARQ